MASPRVLVAGASGYAGALAARIVDRHPHFALGPVTSRSDVGARLDALYPHHRVGAVLEELDVERHAPTVDAAIVAYPHGAAAPVVKALREHGVKVVDLSADFRLRDLATYEEWYVEHPAPELLDEAVYGLPELYREEIRGASLVACPGCFPTAAILALAPLSGRIADAVIDAKTGVSGAGRAATARTHFVSVDENVTPYGVGHHRHMPEIDQEVDAQRPIAFTPHLLPLDQGELVSCYVTHDGRARRARAALRRALRRRAVHRARRPPAGRARRARDELLPHLRPRRPAHRQGHGLRRDRQPAGRARRRRRCRTST